MRTLYLVFFFLFIFLENIYSGNESDENNFSSWKSYLKVELNGYYPNGNISSDINIRQNFNSLGSGIQDNGSIWSYANGVSVGLQCMLYNSNLRMGVSSGLRYNDYLAEVYGSVSVYSDYFYLRYSELDQETKFARVEVITEKKEYFSIPIEFTYNVYNYKRLGLWTSLGGEVGLLCVSHETDIEFVESKMNSYKSIVLESFGSPDEKALSNIYLTLGGSYSFKNGAFFRIDAIVFSDYICSGQPFVIYESDFFNGFMMSLQFPIKK